jgi:RHS repeat-associated protein
MCTEAAANNLNQITSLNGGGSLRFRGSINETSTVAVAGQSVSVVWTNLANSNTLFDATASVSSGVNTIQVVATDYSLNARTNNYQVTVSSQAGRSLAYDLDGNLTNVTDGTMTTNYQWDAVNRLVGIIAINGTTTNLSAFTYDGLSRRVRITELSGITTNSDIRFVWCGTELCEERDATGTNVTKRFLAQGEQIGGTNYFFNRDHLGSIREMADSSGTIRARYNYDPYGRRSVNQVSVSPIEADFGFTGHYFHAPSGLHLALYRGYSSDFGRWISRDPSNESDGLNIYEYAGNAPIDLIDSSGLAWNRTQCVALLLGMLRKAALVVAELAKFDPAVDATGNFYVRISNNKWRQGTPNGHRNEIEQLQQGIKNDIDKYRKNCKNDCDGSAPPLKIPSWLADAAYEPIPVPQESLLDQILINIPGSDATWNNIAVGSAVVGTTSAAGALIISTGGAGALVYAPAFAY